MSDDTLHQLVIHNFGTRAVVEILGEVDQSNAESIAHELRIAAAGKLLVIDLRSTTYFDSAGVAMLHGLRQFTELALVAEPGSIVRRVLEITGLDQLVPMLHSTDDDSLSSLQSPS